MIFLKEIITNPKTNQSIKSKAIESIAEIIEKKPSLAQETFILIKGIIANSNTNYDIESVTKSMTKIVKLNPIQEAFTFLKVAVMNSKIDAYVKAEAIESMAEVIKTIPSLAQEIITFLKKVIIDSDADYYVKYAAIKSIQKIVIEMPNLLPEIFIFFKSVIINSNTETYVKSDATYTITKILKAEPNLAQEAVDFLKEILINPNGKVSNATAWNLVEIIESIPLNESSYKPISELLKIIVINNIQNFDKELYIETKATLTLHKITNHITQEYEKRKNPKMIKWFNGCFKELPNIAETRVFLKEICKTILKSGVINQLESQFILNCVKNYHFTFTVAVNKDHKKIAGEIIFEDRRYEIFQNDNLEEFATMLLAATDDPLAEQYKTHKPLFQSKGLGLKIAASDIMEVNSITYEKTKLPTEASLLSYVRDIKDNSVILLEKRNVFGTHLIYKFNNNNFENVATIYPPYISNEIRKQIFEELESEKLIPCFIKNKIFNFNRCELVNEKGKSFLQNVKNIIQDEKVELQTSNFKLLNVGTDKRLDTHEEIIDDLGKDLKDGGITNKAEINREVERLKQENPKLYNYCNALFWNTKNILKACGIAETEFFKNNIKKTIGERIILFGIKFFNPVIKDLPFVGAIADFITDTIEDIICVWLEKRQDRKLKNKIISINDILRHKIGMQDVEDYFKKIAITITHARKNEIINPKEISQPNSLVQKFQACVQKAGNMIYDKTRNILLPEIIESCDKDNIAVQLALKDSIAFINYLYTNYDDILNDDFDLYEQCKKIVENGTLDALFTQTNKKF